jgi:hypothetical protein
MKLLAKRQLENFANAKCSETVCASCNLYDDCIDGYIDVIAQTALVYREMLKRLEWECNYTCKICNGNKHTGHKPDCELAALLKESEVEEG